MVRGGSTPEGAARDLRRLLPAVAVDEALLEFLKETGRIRVLRNPPGLDGDLPGAWYAGPDLDTDSYWPPLRDLLLTQMDEDDVASIDRASTKVVSRLPCPGSDLFSGRGLVLGHVQSGKTANFTAVISKAVDSGYRLVIVLSGITNALRRQTQARLDRELVEFNRAGWITLTSEDQDFRIGKATAASALLTTGKPLLCVVKKNGVVLRRLLKWLSAASQEIRMACPTLVIDDEADQASVNTGSGDDDRTKVNERIVQLLELLPGVAYVGYTATPFANVFIDPAHPRDLYPRDFIVDLPRPETYFGAERIFGRDRLFQDETDEAIDGLDLIRIVPDADAIAVKPSGRDWANFQPGVPPSLADAIDYFLLATAARAARGQSGSHSSMLIHTTLYAAVHARFQPIVRSHMASRLDGLRRGDNGLLDHLRVLWERENQAVPAETVGEEPTSFDALLEHAERVAADCQVIVENSRSEWRLSYEGEPKVLIVVGGNVLSRGLTLEGLVVSYFVRAATTYDTLLQMGRWFGYRRGYADLPRIWMTAELDDAFGDLALVEREIRLDIRRYEIEGITPLAFSPRIRTHPTLMITSALKMQHAVDCHVSYANRFVQTILFNHRDPQVVKRNLAATRSLVTRNGPAISWNAASGRQIRSGVSVDEILAFISEYSFHRNNVETNPRLLDGYIKAQVSEGQLTSWTIAIVGRQEGGRPIDLGHGLSVGLLKRSRVLRPDDEYAYLGVITSDSDLSCDLGDGIAGLKSSDWRVIDARNHAGPLLLLYPIDRTSRPAPGSTAGKRPRAPLDAVDDLVGVAFVFPEARNLTPQGYKTVDRSGIEREEQEVPIEEDESE